MPQMKRFEYTPPNEIDGDPAEVATITKAVLNAAADMLEPLVRQAAAQLRNSYMTEVLEEPTGMTPEQLAEAWRASDERAEIERIKQLTAAWVRCVRDLESGQKAISDS